MVEPMTNEEKVIVFQRINDKLCHIDELSLDELKNLYNKLFHYEDEYKKYMFDLKYGKLNKIMYILFVVINCIFLAIRGISLTSLLRLMPVASYQLLYCYNFGKLHKDDIDRKYEENFRRIGYLINHKHKDLCDTLDVTITKDTQEQVIDLNRKSGEQVHEKPLTLKRELIK